MHIAVIIPAYNVAPWLPDCLASLHGQTHAGWSAVVVDDGSSDATASIAKACGDPRVRVVRQSNSGVAAARNRGIATVCDAPARWHGKLPLTTQPALDRDRPDRDRSGRKSLSQTRLGPKRPDHSQDDLGLETKVADAVLFLDADDWLAVDALSKLANLLEASPWAVAACGGYARVSMDGAAHSVRPPPEGTILSRLLVRNLFANGGHLLIRREAIEEAGVFRPELTYGEDWEYWTRLALLGEFVSLRSREPVLFVRERQGSLYRTMAADPACYRPSLNAVFSNGKIRSRLGTAFVQRLRARAEAEIAWVIGRELIRHGRPQDGRQWLGRSFRQAPHIRRLGLMGLSWLQAGPFRPYRQTA